MLDPSAYNRLLTEEEVRPLWEAMIKKAIEEELEQPKPVEPVVTIARERKIINPALTARFSGTFQTDPPVSPRFSSPRALEAQRSPRLSTESRKIDTPVPSPTPTTTTSRSNTARYESTVRTPKSTSKLTDSSK